MKRCLAILLCAALCAAGPAWAASVPDLSGCPGLEVTWMPEYNLIWSGVSSGGVLVAQDKATGKYGLVDTAGNIVVPCTYEERIYGYDRWTDRAEISKEQDAPLRYFDPDGKLVETPYKSIGLFRLDRAPVVDAATGKCGFIDRQYREVIPCLYDQEGNFDGFSEESGGYVIMLLYGRPGVLDRDGHFVIPEGWDGVESVSRNGTRMVAYRTDAHGNRQRALLDGEGNVLVGAGTYEQIDPYRGGLAAVGTGLPGDEGARWGAVDMDGNLVIPMEYSIVDIRQDTLLWGDAYRAFVWDGSYWGMLDDQGGEILPCAYRREAGERFEEAGSWDPPMRKMWRAMHPGAAAPVYPEEYEDGLIYFVENDKIGFRDESGAAVIPAVFDGICGGFDRGYCALKKDGCWGLVKNPLYRDRVSGWAQAELDEAEALGLVTARTGDYRTYEVTRLEFAELAVNLVEKATGRAAVPAEVGRFRDTDDETARKATALGIVNGTGDGLTFSPDSLITREEIAVMLYRSLAAIFRLRDGLGFTPVPTDLSGYTDGGAVSGWAAREVSQLAAMGVMAGTSGTTLSPQDNATVEQAILLTLRLYRAVGTQDKGGTPA